MIPLLPVKLRLLVQEDLLLLMKETFPVPGLLKLLPDRGFLVNSVVAVVLVVLVALIQKMVVSLLVRNKRKDAGLPRMEGCPASG